METFTEEFLKYSYDDKAQKVRSEMVRRSIEEKLITLKEYQDSVAFGRSFINIILHLYRKTSNQKYLIE